MSVGSNPDGGYVVPAEIESEIGRRLTAISPIRGIAGHARDLRQRLQEAVHDHGPGGRLGRRDRSAAADRLADARLAVVPGDGALRHAGGDRRRCSRTAAVNIDEWLAAEVEQAFAAQEGAAFVTGDGTNKPKGFLAYTKVANASWDLGQDRLRRDRRGRRVRRRAIPSDVLVDLVYALKAGYRQNGTFVMNRKTQSAVRKFKDESGHYLWQPPAQAGGRATLMTFPVVEAEDMPDVAANSLLDRVRRFPPRLSGGRPRRACACCAIRSPPSPMCCSTPPSASAAACRTSTRSSC